MLRGAGPRRAAERGRGGGERLAVAVPHPNAVGRKRAHAAANALPGDSCEKERDQRGLKRNKLTGSNERHKERRT